MTQVCRVCAHPKRKSIDSQIVSGAILSELAKLYQVPYNSMIRHKDGHIPAGLARRAELSLQDHNQSLLNRMESMMGKCEGILESAERDGHRSLSLKSLEVMNKIIPNLGKILFSMGQVQSQGLNPGEVEEFRKWKQDKANFGERLRSLPNEEREFIQKMCLRQLSGTNPGHGVKDIEIVEEVPEAPKAMRRTKPRKPKDS